MTIRPNVVALASSWPGVTLVEAPLVEVRIDGRAEPRLSLDWLEWAQQSAPRARLSAGLGTCPATGTETRLEHLADRLAPGSSVSVTLLRGGVLPGAARRDVVLFEGRVERIEMNLDADGEHLAVQAEDAAAEVLRRRVGGRRSWAADGTAARLDGLTLVFNPDGQPNASATRYDPGSRDPYTIFSPNCAAGSAAWTLDEAVAYLLAEHAGADGLAVPSPSEVRAMVPAIVLRDVLLEGRTLGESLGAILELVAARLQVTAEPGESAVSRRLDLWMADKAPSCWLSHQMVGGVYHPAATSFAGMTARLYFDAAPRHYVAKGDLKLYESTFDLVEGWDDALVTYAPEDFSPSSNPNFQQVRDVFRKWVLNEDGRYTADPYGRGPAADLSDLFEGAPYVRRPRRFLPCLSRDALGRSRGVYVEVSLDGGETWRRLSQGVRVLPDECGVYLMDDPLPPRYLEAAMRGQVRVRVTATIESDSRLEAVAAAGNAFLPGRTRYLHVPSGFRFRRVSATSRFCGQGDADEADDTARLNELVTAAAAADRCCPAPTRIEIPYLAFGYRVGQRVLGIRGRRIDLTRRWSDYEVAPVVRRIRHTFAPSPRTELELE